MLSGWLRWAALLLGVVGESWPVVTLGHAKWLGIRSGRAATRGDLVSFSERQSVLLNEGPRHLSLGHYLGGVMKIVYSVGLFR